MSFANEDYVEVYENTERYWDIEPGFGVRFRTTNLEDYPRLGFSLRGETATPAEARQFAKALIEAADEAEKKNEKRKKLPKGWPPRPCDVWKGTMYEYHVCGNGGNMYSGEVGERQSLKNLIKDVEERGYNYTLVYRKGGLDS
jgi:hypothetical protein